MKKALTLLGSLILIASLAILLAPKERKTPPEIPRTSRHLRRTVPEYYRDSTAGDSSIQMGPVTPLRGSDTADILKQPEPVIYDLPKYPECVRKARVFGTVSLEATVAEDGHVSNVTLVKSLHPILDVWATGAVREWKFVPAKEKDMPVAVKFSVKVPFSSQTPTAPCRYSQSN